jgi:hypothetical protein
MANEEQTIKQRIVSETLESFKLSSRNELLRNLRAVNLKQAELKTQIARQKEKYQRYLVEMRRLSGELVATKTEAMRISKALQAVEVSNG